MVKKKGWFGSLGKWTRFGVYGGIVVAMVANLPRAISLLGIEYEYFGLQGVIVVTTGFGLTIAIFTPIGAFIGYLIDRFKK